MTISEKAQHNLLLLITASIFLIFSTGLAIPSETDANTTIITTG